MRGLIVTTGMEELDVGVATRELDTSVLPPPVKDEVAVPDTDRPSNSPADHVTGAHSFFAWTRPVRHTAKAQSTGCRDQALPWFGFMGVVEGQKL